ncbi:hypothetical protein [Pseudosulfitobacter sp. DSM 107133]|uniref:hypothetical protein n=1 Tax=Pseudosulfitobacter sp. DSM 107133 TaxID=2883100 RepID=UPI000DF3C3BB|nr:hypothetical protein [Pseudosulfitobacter sp. DSM 107133]UOA27700.1 hypothetical protein DSM107133_02432 [Pseudosulfitobacter sp. DSM 107133]
MSLKALTTAAATGVLGVGAAQADRDLSIHPAAQCAALWLGYSDCAANSPYLAVDPADADRAAAFRAVALRLGTSPRAQIDHFIALQRPLMEKLVEAMIFGRDRQSTDVFEALDETCKSFAKDHPETRKLS